jgi:predicted MPP superfamily phosphohydrolase
MKYRRMKYRHTRFTRYHYIAISITSILLTCITINVIYDSHLTFLYLLPASSLEVTHTTVPIRGLTQPLTLLHLSDIHYSVAQHHGDDEISLDIIKQALSLCHTVQPDLLIVTGDVIDTKSSDDVADTIARMIVSECKEFVKLGIYATLGNHDSYSEKHIDDVMHALQSHGIHVLNNQAVEVELNMTMQHHDTQDVSSNNDDARHTIDKPMLVIVGLTDYHTTHDMYRFNPSAAFRFMHPDVPRFVLSHQPDSWIPLMRYRTDLILSGHLHGGGICIPSSMHSGRNNNPALLYYLQRIHNNIPDWMGDYMMPGHADWIHYVENWQWNAGLYELNRYDALEAMNVTAIDLISDDMRHREMTRLYVNKGLTDPYRRLFCDPEAAVINLIPS